MSFILKLSLKYKDYIGEVIIKIGLVVFEKITTTYKVECRILVVYLKTILFVFFLS